MNPKIRIIDCKKGQYMYIVGGKSSCHRSYKRRSKMEVFTEMTALWAEQISNTKVIKSDDW